MTTEDTRALVTRVYAAYAEGDMDTVFAACADDICWCSDGSPAVLPWAGRYDGRAAVATYFQRAAAAVTVERFELREIIADGDRAAVVTQVTVRVNTSGRTISTHKVDTLTVKDGRIVDFCEYYDTALVSSALRA
ncbi:MAG: nuclear transport factor 2 family protein [Alphaproteobacteria bacterium]